MSAPIVSIITRTRDRPIFLKRAVQSVLGQGNPPDFEWIVVNDAGDSQEVEKVLAPARNCLGNRLKLLHLDSSQGMEHASNRGISQSSGNFLVIHDDDDSWKPDFLEKMVQWLEFPEHKENAGVVCHSIRIEEILEEGGIKIIRESPFNFWLQEITPWCVLEQNPFPPISFLFRREAYQKVGPFDESLPVLGDWEFNLRLLLNWPLGLLPEALANYHHRTSSTTGAAANSITAGHNRHQEWDLTLRKRWQTSPPQAELKQFGALARIARASKSVRDSTHQLLSLPIRPGPQV